MKANFHGSEYDQREFGEKRKRERFSLITQMLTNTKKSMHSRVSFFDVVNLNL